MKSETLTLLAVLIVAALAYTVTAQASPLDFVLEPIARLDIAGTHLRYHLAVDAILFFALFLALSQITLRGQFPGRAGGVLVFAVATALTISLLLAESAVGFSLRDFGPVAAALFVAIFAVVLYRFVSHLGLGIIGSGALAVAIAWFGARAAAPTLLAYAFPASVLAWLNLGAVTAVLVFVGRAGATLFHGKDIMLGQAADALRRPLAALRERSLPDEEARHLEQERGAVSGFLSRIVDRPWKDSAEILADLVAIRKAIERFGSSRQARSLIAEKIRAIAAREHVVLERLKILGELNTRLRAFDLRLLTRLRSAYDGLSDEERERVKAVFAREVQKLSLEDNLSRLEKEFLGYDAGFRDALEHVVAGLRLGQTSQAREWVDRAIRAEGRAEELMEEIDRLEEQVKALTKVPLSELHMERVEQGVLFP
ncbi:MAG: hypothetical protein HYY93_09865 [Planctomycetes bacterium]|nr:hypothetical protein [Planctomycetota bacterium]